MPGAALDLRRRAQCGDVCWDTCGLAAFGLWTTRKRKEPRCCKAYRAFRLSTLHVLYGFVVSSNEIASKTIIAEKHFCISAVLLFPCVYGMALSLWHFYFVWMLGVSVSYAASKRMLTHQMCDRAAAVEPTCASSGLRKPKPWNISCIKGRKNKKNDAHDVLLHLPASQLQDPHPGRVALCLQCGSCRCAAHVLWTACMATCLARISFSQTAAVCVVLVVVWR